ncbi:MAG: pyrroloquinoline quinone biosynthesis peptide chaperone PqqD [Pseudomonadota bacterium]
MTAIQNNRVPHLPRGVRLRRCKVRKAWFLLAPERAVRLDDIGAHILQSLDGERDFAGVVAHLAAQFDAPREQIAKDVEGFLSGMHARRMVEVK